MYILEINNKFKYLIDSFIENYDKKEGKIILSFFRKEEVETISSDFISLAELNDNIDIGEVVNLQVYYNNKLLINSNSYCLEAADIGTKKTAIINENNEVIETNMLEIAMIFSIVK
jgi:hypothetical protein